MGQVKIIENKGEGLYRVEIIKDVERAKKRVEFLNEQITKMNAELTDMLAKVPGIESRLNAALLVVEQKRQDMAENDYWLDQAKQALVTANNELDLLELNRSIIQADIDTLQAEIDSGTLTQPEIDARVIQIAALQVQRNSLSDQIAVKKADIKGIEANIDRLSDYSKLVKSIEEAVLEAEKIGMEFDRLRVQIRVHETIIAAKQKTAQEYAAVIADKDEQDAWAIDYAVDLTAREQPYVSIEIEDEPEGVKIGAYTYTPIQEDIDLKQSVYDEVVTKQEDYHQKYLDEQALATEWAGKVFEVEQKIVQVSLTIATLEGVNEDGFYTTQIENLNLELEDLNRELQTLMLEQAKHENLAKKWQGKEVALLPKRNRLAKDIQDLTPVVAANEIYKPVVNEFTKKFQPTQASSPEAVFFNKSLLPGVQKWMPTFRRGTIMAIHANDLCDVELFDGLSSQQNLKINRQNNLFNVPIKYGDCNAAAFEIGDEVVVEFLEQKQDKPCVIGFQTHPKQCGLHGLMFRPASPTALVGWGLPLKDAQGVDINPPLGTIGGTNSRYFLAYKEGSTKPILRRNLPAARTAAGNQYFKSEKGDVYSWMGSNSGHISYISWPFSQPIFPQFVVIAGRNPENSDLFFNFRRNARGAVRTKFIFKDGKALMAASKTVLGVGKIGDFLIYACFSNAGEDILYYAKPGGVVPETELLRIKIKQDGLPADTNYVRHYVYDRTRDYHFSENGTKAVAHIDVYRGEYFPEVTTGQNLSNEYVVSNTYSLIVRINISIVSGAPSASVSYEHAYNDFPDFQDTVTETGVQGGDFGTPTYTRTLSRFRDFERLLGIGFNGNEESKVIERSILTASSDLNATRVGSTGDAYNSVSSGGGSETITIKIGSLGIKQFIVNTQNDFTRNWSGQVSTTTSDQTANSFNYSLLYANVRDESFAFIIFERSSQSHEVKQNNVQTEYNLTGNSSLDFETSVGNKNLANYTLS